MFDIVFILLIGIYVINQFKEIKNSILVSTLLMLVPIIVRYGFGTDYFSYLHMYNRIEMSSLSRLLLRYEEIGIGFKLLIALAKEFNISFHIFSIIINSTTLIFIVLWIKDNSDDKLLSILLFYAMYYFVWVLSAYRQGFVLALTLYYLFNKKKNMNIRNKIILIGVLSLIHPSALMFIVFGLLDKIEWTKKKHIIFLGIAIISTFLPLQEILNWLPSFSFVEKVNLKYLNDTVKFYDFPGIIRLIFFVSVIFFYDKYDNEERQNYVDRFLYGVSIYFFLKFSEITAARSTIFTFFNFLIIVPLLLKTINKFRHIILVTVLFFSVVYYNKELTTMLVQSKYLANKKYFITETILQKNIENFGSRDSFEIMVREYTKDIREAVLAEQKLEFTEHKNDVDYVPIKIKNEYLLLNEEGYFLEGYVFDKKPSIYGDVALTWEYSDGYFFTNPKYIDLTGGNRSQNELKKHVLLHIENSTHTKHREKYVKTTYTDIPDSIRYLYSNEAEVTKIVTNRFFEPNEYHIMTIHYHNSKSYIYLDKSKNLLIDVPIKHAKRYTSNIIELETYEGIVYFNNRGEIIWWE